MIEATYCMFSHSLIFYFSLLGRVLFLIYRRVAFERLGHALMAILAFVFRKINHISPVLFFKIYKFLLERVI